MPELRKEEALQEFLSSQKKKDEEELTEEEKERAEMLRKISNRGERSQMKQLEEEGM